MVSFWPWGSGGKRIKDLKANELADAATSILQKRGRNSLSARLIYRALELNSYEPQALLMLSEYYRAKKGGRPTGDEIYSGLVIEFAVDPKSPLTAEQKRPFDKARLENMNMWGFVTPRAGDFDVDYLGYMTFINQLAAQVGSLGTAFKTALVKLGVHAGILDPSKGGPSPAYQEWLRADAETLER